MKSYFVTEATFVSQNNDMEHFDMSLWQLSFFRLSHT